MNPEVPPSDPLFQVQPELQSVPPLLPREEPQGDQGVPRVPPSVPPPLPSQLPAARPEEEPPPLPAHAGSSEALREALGLPSHPAAVPGSDAGTTRNDRTLDLIAWGVGALQFFMAVAVVWLGAGVRQEAPVKIGYVVGLTALWPLLIVGLFSLFRRFRNSRSRRIIVICVWALCCFSHMGNLAIALGRGRPQVGKATPVVAPVVPGKGDEMPAPFGTEAPTSLLQPQVAALGDAAGKPELGQRPGVARRRSSGGHDLSTGSHERLAKQIGQAQTTAYSEVVEAYRQASKAYPQDAELALERVLFIEHFSDLEDSTIESAAADLEEAHADLLARFPEEPETLLHELERSWGEDFEGKALACAPKSTGWTQRQRARFALLRAQRCDDTTKADRLRFSQQSFDAEPGVQAGLLLAESLVEAGRKKEASRLLATPVFGEAQPWQRHTQMELHFKLGEAASGVRCFRELEEKSPGMVRNTQVAAQLAEAGAIDLARKVLDALPDNEWSRERQAGERFKFELRHGDAAQAEAAYRKLRENGLVADPFLGKRLQLLLRHPSAGWTWGDLGAGLCLLLLLGVAALVPLLLLVPVHYWSLLRQRAGKRVEWQASPWGLRGAWLMMGAMAVGMTLSTCLVNPDLFIQGAQRVAAAPVPGAELLRGQLLMWAIMTMLCLGFLWRARRWDLFGAGRWSAGKSVGVGLGAGLGLRLLLALYIAVFSLTGLGFSQALPQVGELLLALRQEWGVPGMLAVAAVFVPLLEELVFRGVLLGALARHIPFWAANLLQAVCFTLVHEDHRLIPFFLGFALVAGLLVRRSGGLLGALCLHALNNLLACLGLLALRQAG